jgi:CheY-like chemotaxis protein
VTLWLPASAEPVGERQAKAEKVASTLARGTALLVDDEDLVRESTANMLTDLGWLVIEADSGEAAISCMRTMDGPDLLITDYLMPGMSGAELARQVRAIRPELPILIVSGYAEAEGIASGLPRLNKPFRKDELASTVSSLLGAAHN